ncbi:MAG: hypothetical protein AAGN82_20290 [Myxococcota bacterium]
MRALSSWGLAAVGLLGAVSSGHGAPLQCGSSTDDPSLAREERPGAALYGLAAEFRASGNRDAWAATLQYLIRRHPSSRFAAAAADDLAQAGLTIPAPPP